MKPFLILLSFFIIRLSAAQDTVDNFIRDQMEKNKIVGLSVGIVKDGKVLKAQGFGTANLEHGVKASEATVYKLGSVSKHIIATAIMKLVEEGKLSLQDPVRRFFKDAPRHWSAITIRHLLNHTSGLQRESPAFDPLVEKPDSVLIKAAYQDTLAFATGTKWQYCNLSYFMLADIIRQVTAQPFASYMRKEIFLRHGLLNTRTTTVRPVIPGRADGYVVRRDTLFNAEEYVALRPSGAFLSTIQDMLQWELLLQQNKILSQKSLQQMWTDKVKTTATASNGEVIYYGYGWRTTRYLNRNAVFHSGVLPGFRAVFYRFPEEKTAIILLTNSEPGDIVRIAEGLADILFAK